MKKNPIRCLAPAILGFFPYLAGLGIWAIPVFLDASDWLDYVGMALAIFIYYFLWWLFSRLSFHLTQCTLLCVTLLNLPSFLYFSLYVVNWFSSTPVIGEIAAQFFPAYFAIGGIMLILIYPLTAMLFGLIVMSVISYAGCQYQKHKSN